MANYADHFNNLSGNYYNITTDYIKENPDERAHLWSILLNYLHDTIGLTEGQIAYNTTQVFHIINKYCDFPDEAFTGLIVSLTEDLNNNDWLYTNVPHWNESWNTALETFIKGVCPTYMVDGEPYDPKAMYENSCPIYVDEEGGLIAPDIIRGGLTNSYIVPLRIKDMKEADAGANFVTVDQLYSHTEVAAGINSDVDITFEFKHMDKVEEYLSKLDEADSLDDVIADLQAAFDEEYAIYEPMYRRNRISFNPYNQGSQKYGNVDMDNRQKLVTPDGYVETVLGAYAGPFYIENQQKFLAFCYSCMVQQDSGTPRVLTDEEIDSYLEKIVNEGINWDADYDEHDELDFTKVCNDIYTYDEAHYGIMSWPILGTVSDRTETEIVEWLKTTTVPAVLSEYLHFVGKYGSLQLLEQDIADTQERQAVLRDEAAAIKDQYFKDCADVKTEYDHYKNGESSYFKKIEVVDGIRLIYKHWSTYEDLFDKPISDNYRAFLNDVRYYAKDVIWDYWTNRFNTIDDRYSIVVHCETEPRKFYSLIAPWVIPWYNINGKSYSQVRGADKLVSVLANEKRLQFTQDDEDQKWIRLIMPKNTRRVEIEDLNRNFWVIAQVITGIGTYLFDPNGPIPLIIRTSIQEIADMWENVENLWGAICALGQKPHVTDVRTMVVPLTSSELQPFLKYDNFDNIDSYATMRAACEARLNYLKSQYSNSHLVVIPEIRLNNYEKNYYSRVCYPGIMKLNRNVEPLAWTWQDISQSETAYDIDLSDIAIASHKSHTYGLRESSEETYNYYVPLSKAVSEADGKRYYELLRPSYVVGGIYNNQQNTLTGSVSITYWDAARQAAIGNTVKVWENGQWLNPSVSESGIVTVPITRGYYQGELLSTYKESESISHLAKVIYVELEPETLTSEQAREKNSARIQDANNVLQYYFTNELRQSNSYSPDQLYILIGHFYYSGIEGSGLEYWTTSGKVASQDSHYKAGNQGVDVGTVVYLPGKHNTPIVYGGAGAYWAYSIYDSSEWSGSSGAASYRFELYTKNGRITDDASSWYLKMISIASLRQETNTTPSPASHYFVHSVYPTYIYTNRRIFIYELDGVGNIRERKWEREDLANDFSYTMNGSISFDPSRYTYKSVQDLGSSHAGQMQILKVNTNYGNNYPEYENYRNNGYTE